MQPKRKDGFFLEVRRRMCEEKQYFNNEIEARAVGQFRGERVGRLLFVYLCPICHGWHLTSQKKSQKKSVSYLEE